MKFTGLLTTLALTATALGAPNGKRADSIVAAEAKGIDVYGPIPDDAVKVEDGYYTAEEGTDAWAWIRAQIDLPNTEETRREIEKRQGYANIGIGMFAQDWCKSLSPLHQRERIKGGKLIREDV